MAKQRRRDDSNENETKSSESNAKKKEKTNAQQMGELILCLGVAFGLALLIKAFVLELFTIPSGSMEPTLHGRPDGGDRVLCTKLNYYWRDPKRWEIFVFLFPYETAKDIVNDPKSVANFKGQNFIKRCIGLPGETIAIRRGDIFVLNRTNRADLFERQTKPDSVQRTLWIPVYEEDFSDLVVDGAGQLADFDPFWKRSGQGDWAITPANTLTVVSQNGAHFSYRPWVRNAFFPKEMKHYDGIVDRYVLRQAVTFQSPDGVHAFRKTIWNQKIAARCPWTNEYVMENRVSHYDRRCDLPLGSSEAKQIQFGRFHERPFAQGEDNFRYVGYHIVPDLRLTARVKLTEGTTLRLDLQDDDTQRQAILRGGKNGSAALTWNGKTPAPNLQKNVSLAPDIWHDIEFYCVDGEARLFVDSTDAPLLTAALPMKTPDADTVVKRSGAMLSVSGGAAEFKCLRIDRDIYYFSGAEEYVLGTHYTGENESMRKDRFIVGKNEYMAMGDNCPSSNDSRTWGGVPIENRRGPAVLIWWPLRRARILQTFE